MNKLCSKGEALVVEYIGYHGWRYRKLLLVDTYRKTSNISRTLVGNNSVHSDVVGVSPVGAAPTTSSFSTQHLASMDWAKQLQDEASFEIWCGLY